MNTHDLITQNLQAILDLAYYTNVTIAGNAIEYTIQPDCGMPQTISVQPNDDGTIAVTTMAEDMDTLVERMPASCMANILSDDCEAASNARAV